MKRKIIISMGIALVFIPFVFGIAHAQISDPKGGSSQGGANTINDAANKKGSILLPDCIRSSDKARTEGLSCVTESVTFYTNILLFVVAVSSLFYMLYGAFLYSTAFGDESKIGRAKKTITYAIVGVILSGSALLIVRLIRSILKA